MADMLQRVAISADKTGNPGYDKLTSSTSRKAYLNATKDCFAVPAGARWFSDIVGGR
jgi:hypothetical protein